MAGLTVPDFPNFFILLSSELPARTWWQRGRDHGNAHALCDRTRFKRCSTGKSERWSVAATSLTATSLQWSAAHERMVWTRPGMSTYYRNEQGRVVVIYPFRNVDLFQATRHFSLDDFLAEPSHTSESDSPPVPTRRHCFRVGEVRIPKRKFTEETGKRVSMRTDYKFLEVHVDKGIVDVVLNRPEKRNALTFQMPADLDQILKEAMVDDEVKVLMSSRRRKGILRRT